LMPFNVVHLTLMDALQSGLFLGLLFRGFWSPSYCLTIWALTFWFWTWCCCTRSCPYTNSLQARTSPCYFKLGQYCFYGLGNELNCPCRTSFVWVAEEGRVSWIQGWHFLWCTGGGLEFITVVAVLDICIQICIYNCAMYIKSLS